MAPISDPPSTSSHSTNGYPSPLPPKQTQKGFTQIIYPTEELSVLQSTFSLDIISATCVVPSSIPNTGPSIIPSTGYPNIILYPVPYLIPNHSTLGSYLLPSFLPDTVFFPPIYHQCHRKKNYMNTKVLIHFHPQN